MGAKVTMIPEIRCDKAQSYDETEPDHLMRPPCWSGSASAKPEMWQLHLQQMSEPNKKAAPKGRFPTL
jgi:hypothetical protein